MDFLIGGKVAGYGATFKSWLSSKGFYAKQIPASTLEAFYNEGAKQQEGKSKKVTKAKTKGTGKVTAEKSVENTPIHKLAEAIASKTGLDFEIRDGSILVTDASQNALTDADGNEIYSNGQFRADISKVVLGVNDKAYQTLAHEAIGEFLEAYNPEDMQEIQVSPLFSIFIIFILSIILVFPVFYLLVSFFYFCFQYFVVVF